MGLTEFDHVLISFIFSFDRNIQRNIGIGIGRSCIGIVMGALRNTAIYHRLCRPILSLLAWFVQWIWAAVAHVVSHTGIMNNVLGVASHLATIRNPHTCHT